MFAKTFMFSAVAALTAASMAPAAAEARPWGDDGYHQVRHDRDEWRGDRKRWDRGDRHGRWGRDRYRGDRYYGRRYYGGDRYYYGGGRRYYGDRGYYYGDRGYYGGRRYYGRRCDSGTGGTILGAIAGGLLGDAVVGRYGDNTTGAIVGAGVGALAGRAIDRNC